jgi:dTDP-glucose 4,6-dehydratase
MNRTFRRLLVAGGAGFIGSNFVRLLRRTRPSTEVWVLDKLTYAGNLANLAEFEGTDGYRFFHGDICDVELVDKLAGEVDAMVNFAAETHVDRSLLDPFAFVTADVLGTAVLCSAAGTHGHEVFHLVSTDEVYGDVAEGRSREDDPFRPRSPYAASKAGGEHLAWAFAVSHELPLLVTRGSNTYGPYQYPEKSVPVFVTNALDDLPLPLYNDGSAVRDYLHVEDHCRAIDLVLHQGTPGHAYNVGTGIETSGNQLAGTVLDLLGKPRSLIQYVADRKGHDYRYALDTARLERELGWRPEIDLRGGLERTIGWYRENEPWWRPLKSDEYWEYYRRNYRPLPASP